MNLILFDAAETAAPLARTDPRARHLLDVLRRREGDTFDAGLVNGPQGKGTLVAIGPEALTLTFQWGAEPPPPDPLTLLIGLPRPQTARDILRDATTLGVAALHFVTTEKSEGSYAHSTLWSSGEWRRHVLAGAAQAFATRIPEVTWGHPLAEVVAGLGPGRKTHPDPAAHAAGYEKEVALRVSVGSLDAPGPAPGAPAVRIALDNYEAAGPLGDCHIIRDIVRSGSPASPPGTCQPLVDMPMVLAFGPERGWGAGDRARLRAHGFTLAHLGPRVLRTETAVVAALAVVKSLRGAW